MLKFLKLDKVIDNASQYLEARIELIKLDVEEKVATTIVKAIRISVIAITAFFTVVFASIGLAAFLNHVIGNGFAGYLIVAGFYLLIMIVVLALQNTIQKRVEQIVNAAFNRKEAPKKQIEVVTHSDNGVAEVHPS